MIGLHERDEEADSLKVGGQGLAALLPGPKPDLSQDVVEGFDTVWRRGLCQRSESNCSDHFDFLLVVLEASFDDIDHLTQMRQHGAAHENGSLLDDFDASVTSLP